ncbi:MAG: DUF3050 domain-containing protein [Sphingobacteriia bacterium]|nr:DUF3050 domain-containing protein [Cytophagia bacterium]NDC72448.1 DUF3050 domain-containing protein [Sphingobacteriia bacterium]
MTNSIQPNIERLLTVVGHQRQRLLAHPLYGTIQTLEHVQVFMAHHAFAVWDFMSLVKALQVQLTGMRLPWKPVGDPEVRYLINEIVLGEESDEDPAGGRISHFELYMRAMKEAGVETKAFEQYVRASEGLGDLGPSVGLPPGGLAFNRNTFGLIQKAGVHELAAVFTLGREDLIPDMFLKMVDTLDRAMPGRLSTFKYYLERHIEVDGEHHKHLAYRMTALACGNDDRLWQEAAVAVADALEARLALWDSVMAALPEQGSLT